MKTKKSHRIAYKPAKHFLKKLARVSLFGAGLYILLPTPDGFFIHPLVGSLLSHVSGISFKQGIVISIATFTAIGIILCLIGIGKQIYHKLKKGFYRIYKISLRKRLTNLKCPSSDDTTCPCAP